MDISKQLKNYRVSTLISKLSISLLVCLQGLGLAGCQSTSATTPTANTTQAQTNQYLQQQRLRLHFAREKEARLPTLYPNTTLDTPISAEKIRGDKAHYPELIDYDQDGSCDSFDTQRLAITNGSNILRRFRNSTEAAHDIYGLLSLQLRLQQHAKPQCHLRNPDATKRFIATHNPSFFDTANSQRYTTEVLDLLRAINRQVLQESKQASAQGCDSTRRKQYIHHYFLQNYLWRDLVPEFVDYRRYSSVNELLQAIKAPQDNWSYITRQQTTSTTRPLPYVGFSAVSDNQQTIVRLVHPNSPAANAGLQRGDIITHAEMDQEQGAVKLTFKRHNNILKRTIKTINQAAPTVPVSKVIAPNIGYMMISQFQSSSRRELSQNLTNLRQQGVEQLIVDLRYNPGGLVDVANYFASSIAPQLQGKIFAYSRLAGARHIISKRFHSTPVQAPMKQVVFITSNETISAAEQLILALRPYIPVAVVGSATKGKAVWLEETAICDTHLYAVNATAYNINGDRVPNDGIKPNCTANDELKYATSDRRSEAIRQSLTLLRHKRCGLDSF